MKQAFVITVVALVCGVEPEQIDDRPIPARNEVVMKPESAITAKTSVGTMVITAGKGLKRSYTWDGATRSVGMLPRNERWYGSLGLYYPGPGDHWEEHKGITRGVLSEGQMHFKTEAEAVAWLRTLTFEPHVWRNDGLVVGWGKTMLRRQLSVSIWQIYIGGKKPITLPDSQDEAIIVKERD